MEAGSLAFAGPSLSLFSLSSSLFTSPSPTPPVLVLSPESLTASMVRYAVTGTLKGYDQLLNLVLDEAIEFLRDADDPLKTTDQTRRLGLIVCRGTAVMLVSPTDGTDEIANPFVQPDGA